MLDFSSTPPGRFDLTGKRARCTAPSRRLRAGWDVDHARFLGCRQRHIVKGFPPHTLHIQTSPADPPLRILVHYLRDLNFIPTTQALLSRRRRYFQLPACPQSSLRRLAWPTLHAQGLLSCRYRTCFPTMYCLLPKTPQAVWGPYWTFCLCSGVA